MFGFTMVSLSADVFFTFFLVFYSLLPAEGVIFLLNLGLTALLKQYFLVIKLSIFFHVDSTAYLFVSDA